MNDKDKLLRISQMAVISGHSNSFYYNGKSTGTLDIPWIKIGKSVRVRESDFEKWLNEHIQQ